MRLIEVAALVVFVLCTALLLILRGTRLVVEYGIQMLFLAAVIAGTLAYVLGEIGLL